MLLTSRSAREILRNGFHRFSRIDTLSGSNCAPSVWPYAPAKKMRTLDSLCPGSSFILFTIMGLFIHKSWRNRCRITVTGPALGPRSLAPDEYGLSVQPEGLPDISRGLRSIATTPPVSASQVSSTLKGSQKSTHCRSHSYFTAKALLKNKVKQGKTNPIKAKQEQKNFYLTPSLRPNASAFKKTPVKLRQT